MQSSLLAIVIARSGAGSLYTATGAKRYWRVTFTNTVTGSGGDSEFAYLWGFEDLNRANVFGSSLGTYTRNWTWSETNDDGPPWNISGNWPRPPSSIVTNRADATVFDEAQSHPDDWQFTFDLGAGNEAEVQYIKMRAGSLTGIVPTEFTVSYSDDGVIFTDAWVSNVLSWSAWEEKTISANWSYVSNAGVHANHSKTFVVGGRPSAGQAVTQSKTFVIGNGDNAGLNVSEATTYVVVTP